MDEGLMKVFKAISGWRTPEEFGHDNDGYVTFEDNPKSHGRAAFLWKPDFSHEHLQSMWMGGHTFVRRLIVGLALVIPFSAQAEPLPRDEFVREVVLSLIRNNPSWSDINGHVQDATGAWYEYQRIVEEKEGR
jgi:hypothetical protein